jgi:hypothetical protein
MALLWEQLWLPFEGLERDAFTGLVTFPFGENLGRPADDPEQARDLAGEPPRATATRSPETPKRLLRAARR